MASCKPSVRFALLLPNGVQWLQWLWCTSHETESTQLRHERNDTWDIVHILWYLHISKTGTKTREANGPASVFCRISLSVEPSNLELREDKFIIPSAFFDHRLRRNSPSLLQSLPRRGRARAPKLKVCHAANMGQIMI